MMNAGLGLLTLRSRLPELAADVLEVPLGGSEVTCTQPLYTVVGASVAVCLLDAGNGYVGLCQVILPSQFGHHRDDAMLQADSALEAINNRISDAVRANGGTPRLQAKLFGGADIRRDEFSFSDGKQTAIFTRNWLRTRHIPIVSESLGGTKRREIILLPTEQVYCKQISLSSEFLDRELDTLLKAETPLNKVELF